MASPFLRLAGRLRVPPTLTLVQTSGVVRPSNGSAAVAARTTRGDLLVDESVSPLYNKTSCTEAEWASVYYGLLLAHTNKETAVGLENNSHHVVMSLLIGPPQHPRPYVRYYMCKIMDTAERMDWCGLRWIPKEQNKAARLL
jgi:ribonuclease HI